VASDATVVHVEVPTCSTVGELRFFQIDVGGFLHFSALSIFLHLEVISTCDAITVAPASETSWVAFSAEAVWSQIESILDVALDAFHSGSVEAFLAFCEAGVSDSVEAFDASAAKVVFANGERRGTGCTSCVVVTD
jgi:hypothetical protein